MWSLKFCSLHIQNHDNEYCCNHSFHHLVPAEVPIYQCSCRIYIRQLLKSTITKFEYHMCSLWTAEYYQSSTFCYNYVQPSVTIMFNLLQQLCNSHVQNCMNICTGQDGVRLISDNGAIKIVLPRQLNGFCLLIR